jgi:phosphoglycolate phosphatase-like HAD superfamily hydrolase
MKIAGGLWAEHQLKNATPVKLFSEIKETVHQIYQPQGICSQNSTENINRVLKENDIFHKFKAVIGFDDIPDNMQKPVSFSGIKCLHRIFDSLNNKTIVYIGDHEGDVEFARNIENELDGQSKVISIVATYSGAQIHEWELKPDFEIGSPGDLLKIIGT